MKMDRMNENSISGWPLTPEQTGCRENSTSDDTCPMNGSWDTIIVNQIPCNIDNEKLISLFSQYGEIGDTYLCKKPEWEGEKHERIARITFRNEEDAWKVWETSQKNLIKYDNHVLMITLASEDYSPIQNLPDICLREIFRRVDSVDDKFSVEMVCKRWKDNGRCCWANITYLNSEDYSIDTLRVIFPRIAETLEHLAFVPFEDSKAEFIRAVAAENSPCVHLKSLEFDDIDYGPWAQHIKTIIQQNKNLREFLFSSSIFENHFDMSVMEVLPVGMVDINIELFGDYRPLTTALSRFHNLRILSFRGVSITDSHLIDKVINLERLSFAECFIPQSIVWRILSNNKGLKYLNIGSDDLDDASLICIQRLPKLQVLAMKSDKFTDAYLGAMGEKPTLKALCCHECDFITDEGIEIFFKSASNIEDLCIKDSPITSQSTISARDWTERTGKSLKLTINNETFRRYSPTQWRDTDKLQVKGFGEYYFGELWMRQYGLEFVE